MGLRLGRRWANRFKGLPAALLMLPCEQLSGLLGYSVLGDFYMLTHVDVLGVNAFCLVSGLLGTQGCKVSIYPNVRVL